MAGNNSKEAIQACVVSKGVRLSQVFLWVVQLLSRQHLAWLREHLAARLTTSPGLIPVSPPNTIFLFKILLWTPTVLNNGELTVCWSKTFANID